MQLHERKVEIAILRAYTANNVKATALITQGIDADCFHTSVAKEIYERVNAIANQRGIILPWEDLKHDIALSEDTRNYIKGYKHRPIKSRERLKSKIATLQNLRKARAMVYIAEVIDRELIQRDKVDVDVLHDKITDMVTNARTNNSTNWMTHIGHKNKTSFQKLLKEVMTTQQNRYIPTGIKAFDDVNRGIPRGTNMVIAAPSGWGKSVQAGMLAGSMAKKGAKVALVSLEMNKFEVLQRQVANIGDVDMTALLDPDARVKKEDTARIFKVMDKWDARIEKAGGLFTIVVPDVDVSIKDVFFALKPYNYDVIIIDYVGLLKGTDSDDQVRALGKIGRFSKVYAGATDSIVINCAQLNDEGKVKYAKALTEHASLQWQWQVTPETKETMIVKVEQPKARGLSPHDFWLKANFAKMRFEPVNAHEIPSSAPAEDKSKKHRGDKKKPSGFGGADKSKVYDLENA